MTAELLARLESADGPDRELDAMIQHRITSGVGCGAAQDAPPRYTASIDAALTLVPDGCLSMVRTVWADAHAPTERPVGYASVDRYFKDDAGLFWKENFLALGETPALALAAAALKARGV